MRYLLLITLFSLSGCGARPVQTIPTLEDVAKLEFTVDKSLPLVQQAYSIESEEVCEKNDGKWKRVGRQQKESCVLTADDAGKSCENNSECQVACVAQHEPAVSGTKTPGVCLESTDLFGCRTYVANGVAEPTLCVD